MKLKLSPLASAATGKAADVVASTFHGQPYVRKLVIPKNPQTAAQQSLRSSLGRCVSLWRSLPLGTREWLNVYGKRTRTPGYNIFISQNRALEQAGSLLKVVPDHPTCPAPAAFDAAPGGDGEITCTWTHNAPQLFNHILILARKKTGNIFDTEAICPPGLETKTISGLTPGAPYDINAHFYSQTRKQMGTDTGKLSVPAGSEAPPTKWSCSGPPDYICSEDPLGIYDSLEECQAACVAPDYLVTQAGTPAANNGYFENGVYGGAPAFEKSGGGSWLYYFDGPMDEQWVVYHTLGGAPPYLGWYYIISTAPTPPLGEYTIGTGDPPAAVVS